MKRQKCESFTVRLDAEEGELLDRWVRARREQRPEESNEAYARALRKEKRRVLFLLASEAIHALQDAELPGTGADFVGFNEWVGFPANLRLEPAEGASRRQERYDWTSYVAGALIAAQKMAEQMPDD